MRRRALIAIAVASAASAGGCTVGSGSGAAKGPLWILGCIDGDPKGTPDEPLDFDLAPTFFAAEPIEDISDGPPLNRLIIYMKRNGNATEINDTLIFDIRDSAQIARCIRGQTINGVPTWDTSSGMLDPTGQVDPAAPAWCMQSTTPGALPQIRLVPFGPVAVSFTPFASCHSQMHPPAIVNVAGVASDGFITFTDFGSAVQTDPKQADTAPDARGGISDDFKVNYGEHLQATFQFTVGDERYYAAIRDKIVPPPEPLIGGSLAGNFEFYFERGRSAQTFP